MNFPESLNYLYSLGPETLAMKLGLRNTEELLAALGNPQNTYFKVQIAGTNGKGSTAAFLDAIARAARIETGLFTSPHLISITERIKISGAQISETKFAELTSEINKTAQKLIENKTLETLPTFFEHLTAIGLLAFAREKVDLAILETGLGGRLDSTTAARSEIVAITPVSLDHQEYLGTTLKEIAGEKAAIIRPGVRAVVIAEQEHEAMRVIRGKCRECDIQPVSSAKIIKVRRFEPSHNFEATFETEKDSYSRVEISLPGRHQIENAATAISLAEALREAGFKISRDAIVQGLETAKHTGRLEIFSLAPHRFLLDGAHNVAGAKALRAYLDELVNEPVTLVFGAMRDKDLREIGEILFPAAEKLILTRADNPRSAEPETLRKFIARDVAENKIYPAQTLAGALEIAREITPPGNLICVTGSLYLVGEARQALLEKEPNTLNLF